MWLNIVKKGNYNLVLGEVCGGQSSIVFRLSIRSEKCKQKYNKNKIIIGIYLMYWLGLSLDFFVY